MSPDSSANLLKPNPPANLKSGKPSLRLLIISLALIFGGGLGAHLVQTCGGKVSVLGFKLPTENGQWVAADLFKPIEASATNPVPMVVVCPGFERSKETMSGYSIELARRGIAVITIDPYNQGASSATMQRRSATVEGYGVVAMTEYIHGTPNLNYVDKSRIGAVGYSAGGNAVLRTASRFGAQQAKALRQAAYKRSESGETITEAEMKSARSLNKLAAVFVGGYVLAMTNDVLDTVDANLGMDYALYDEGAYRNEQGGADMESSAESLRLVNSALPAAEALKEIELSRNYGHVSNRTFRVVHNTRNIHPLLPYDSEHVAHMLAFFNHSFQLPPTLPPTNQIWQWKEFFTLASLAGGLLFLIPFTRLLLRLPCFQPLVNAVPAPLLAPGRAGKTWFWLMFAVSALAACFLFIPMARVSWTFFPEATNRFQTWWFPQRINNAILLWAVANGLLGLGIFTLTHFLFGKKQGVTMARLGLKTNGRELARTMALAGTVFAAFYGLLFVCYGIFHTDFRFVFVSAAASFPPKMLLVALEYVPLFFIFYLANSIRVNCGGRFEGQREWVNMLINVLGNSTGLILILAIQYSFYFSTGKVFWKEEWLYANLLFGVIPMMMLLPVLHRYFFRLTGRPYLGPMITCPIFILMMLTSNVCYIPLE